MSWKQNPRLWCDRQTYSQHVNAQHLSSHCNLARAHVPGQLSQGTQGRESVVEVSLRQIMRDEAATLN
jgi:hypothetical protein